MPHHTGPHGEAPGLVRERGENRSRSLWCGSFLQARQDRVNRFRIGWLEHFSAGGGVQGLSSGLVTGPEECDYASGSVTEEWVPVEALDWLVST